MRHLVRPFRDSRRGAGVIEYALLTSGLGVALVGMLTLFGDATSNATHRAAASVAAQATRGYGAPGPVDEGPTEGAVAQGPETDESDSLSTDPDSTAGSGGFDPGSFNPAKP